MKIKILNERLRANGKRWSVGDVVDVPKGFDEEAEDNGLGDMFEVAEKPKAVRK